MARYLIKTVVCESLESIVGIVHLNDALGCIAQVEGRIAPLVSRAIEIIRVVPIAVVGIRATRAAVLILHIGPDAAIGRCEWIGDLGRPARKEFVGDIGGV